MVALLTFSIGIGIGALRWRKATVGSDRKSYRALVIQEQAQQLTSGTVLILGDSLIERQRITTICGEQTLNAGIGSATSADLVALLRTLGTVKPSRVIVNVGANDVEQHVPLNELSRNVEKLIEPFSGRPILIVGVPGGGDADHALETVARTHSAAFMPWPVDAPGDTVDGLHLNASGAAKWQAAVTALWHCAD